MGNIIKRIQYHFYLITTPVDHFSSYKEYGNYGSIRHTYRSNGTMAVTSKWSRP